MLLGTPQNPQIYSWQQQEGGQEDSVEVRFIVQPASPTEPTDIVINYWDIAKKTGNDKDDLDKAYKKLNHDQHCEMVRGPKEDIVPANGKIPVRAIMQTTVPITPPEDDANPVSTSTQISGKFGIIINPPYP